MAKCIACNKTKGKRECPRDGGVICSLCCGTTRTAETCCGCQHFKGAEATRNYRKVPKYSLDEMQHDFDLIGISNVVEGALSSFDLGYGTPLADSTALRLLELLLDKYHFADPDPVGLSEILQEGLEFLTGCITEALDDDDMKRLPKVLGSIYFVATRRSHTVGRVYLDFIAQYVGPSVAPGVRVMPMPK